MSTKRKRLLRFKTSNLLVLMTIASLFFGWIGSEIRKGQARAVAVEQLSKINVSVRHHRPTMIGSVIACFPGWVQSKLSPIFGDQLLKSPSTLSAASLIPSDIGTFLHASATLATLESILILENRFTNEELDQICRNLPGTDVTEVARICNLVFMR